MCDRGRVSEHPVNTSNLEKKYGEWSDVWCVASGRKPLATLDYSNYGRKKINKTKVREVIEYANKHKVQVLHIVREGGVYTKTVFFKPRQFENAKQIGRAHV